MKELRSENVRNLETETTTAGPGVKIANQGVQEEEKPKRSKLGREEKTEKKGRIRNIDLCA